MVIIVFSWHFQGSPSSDYQAIAHRSVKFVSISGEMSVKCDKVFSLLGGSAVCVL